MEAAKASPPEISRVVQDYMNVPVDWREEQSKCPKVIPGGGRMSNFSTTFKRRRKE